ncbi:glycosyltransferase [Roseovarius gahaiensis]|uniref:Glycosyltransferase n=1 Tax=Roseovarius gahaiensis TaxID=2716691 RepID=A0A967BBX5_9RHOB|nr:glycosyltransferase [Roseovarius gahaiensis]NHQ75150.1 glycosyltransferase [Roseovarius gahaiensis]
MVERVVRTAYSVVKSGRDTPHAPTLFHGKVEAVAAMTATTNTLPHLSRDEFDASWYLETYTDVRAAGLDPWEHYLAHGRDEGRLGAPIRALELDHILWRGFPREALVELRLLMRRGSAVERAVAGWVFARHAASRGHWHSAKAAIELFHAGAKGAAIVSHAGPWILGVQAFARCGDMEGAWRLLDTARKRFGPRADITLAEMEVAIAGGEGDTALSTKLGALYEAEGLDPVILRSGPEPRFDRMFTTEPVTPIMDGPMVSVIVPAYGSGATLATCLRGLTAQSWRNLEILLVDDASPDDTLEIAQRMAAEDPRIRVLSQKQNGGAYIARNSGLAAARGAFFTVHDADDWSHPRKIELQVRALLETPAAVANVSNWVRAGDDLSMALWRIEDRWVYRNVSSLMMRMELRESLGYWDRVRANADTEYYHRVLAAYGETALREVRPGTPLAFGRTGADSLTLSIPTHLATQFHGPRRAYLDAALDWHRRRLAMAGRDGDAAVRAATMYLPQTPSQRLFHAPEALGPAEGSAVVVDDGYAKIATSPRFDPHWYLQRNGDVLRADADPVRHYLDHGGVEDRDPGPCFSGSTWRRLRELTQKTVPLLDREAFPAERSVPAPRFTGQLELGQGPVALVFAHAANRQVFGAERSLLRALEALADRRVEMPMTPVVILPSAVNGTYLDDVRARSAVVEILPQAWRHRFRPVAPETLSAIRALIRRYDPAELHVNTLVLNAPLLAARAESCPTIVHVRELPQQDPDLCRILGDNAGGLRRRLLSEADRFIANSQAVADWLACPDRTTIRPNRIDPQLFNLPFAPGPAVRVGLISSNITKKGIADFVEVARLVAQAEDAAGLPDRARCRFRLIGPGSADLDALGRLPRNVVHASYAEGPLAAIGQVDLVTSLSHFAESFGRTVLEAMAAGRPVICYDRGTPPRLVLHGRTGFVAPPDTPAAVARAVLALSTTRLSLLDMSRSARARARELDASADNLDAI